MSGCSALRFIESVSSVDDGSSFELHTLAGEYIRWPKIRIKRSTHKIKWGTNKEQPSTISILCCLRYHCCYGVVVSSLSSSWFNVDIRFNHWLHPVQTHNSHILPDLLSRWHSSYSVNRIDNGIKETNSKQRSRKRLKTCKLLCSKNNAGKFSLMGKQ